MLTIDDVKRIIENEIIDNLTIKESSDDYSSNTRCVNVYYKDRLITWAYIDIGSE